MMNILVLTDFNEIKHVANMTVFSVAFRALHMLDSEITSMKRPRIPYTISHLELSPLISIDIINN